MIKCISISTNRYQSLALWHVSFTPKNKYTHCKSASRKPIICYNVIEFCKGCVSGAISILPLNIFYMKLLNYQIVYWSPDVAFVWIKQCSPLIIFDVTLVISISNNLNWFLTFATDMLIMYFLLKLGNPLCCVILL